MSVAVQLHGRRHRHGQGRGGGPQRDISAYLDDAAANRLRIAAVIGTHVHADFVSGHLEWARVTGASISYGPGAEPEFPVKVLADGQRVS